ncbi:hypothetical protein B5V02_22140 [Mesorhizobium kowhaii]|uniref:Uncharacterized protein n=1 Tax=Mesorhizobium kowhaii TaxID=1300272 RepID=A0A2W7CRT9_9HYPH|nr:hypothetical protein B5V02_22140 [Mesorhizobium kowhaii]
MSASVPIATMERWARKCLKIAKNCGVVEPLPCEGCGARDVFAHQLDLNRPLIVKWLCARCEPCPRGATVDIAMLAPAGAGAR